MAFVSAFMEVVVARLATVGGGRPMPETHQDPEPPPLLRELALLNETKQDSVAIRLAELWDAFETRFGGVSALHEAGESVRQEYIGSLSRSAAVMERAKGSEGEPFYYSTALMAEYLTVLATGASDPHAREIAIKAASLIERGRLLRACGLPRGSDSPPGEREAPPR